MSVWTYVHYSLELTLQGIVSENWKQNNNLKVIKPRSSYLPTRIRFFSWIWRICYAKFLKWKSKTFEHILWSVFLRNLCCDGTYFALSMLLPFNDSKVMDMFSVGKTWNVIITKNTWKISSSLNSQPFLKSFVSKYAMQFAHLSVLYKTRRSLKC